MKEQHLELVVKSKHLLEFELMVFLCSYARNLPTLCYCNCYRTSTSIVELDRDVWCCIKTHKEKLAIKRKEQWNGYKKKATITIFWHGSVWYSFMKTGKEWLFCLFSLSLLQTILLKYRVVTVVFHNHSFVLNPYC